MLFLLMHIVHILTVILWIGGLAFVTGIVLPMVIKTPDALQKVLTFQRIEHRFAPLAKAYNIVVGITVFIMVWQTGWYELYFTKDGWALTFMTAVWPPRVIGNACTSRKYCSPVSVIRSRSIPRAMPPCGGTP